MRPVLIVECLADILGGQRVALQIAGALQSHFPVVLACPGEGPLADAAREAGHEVRISPALGNGSPLALPSSVREIRSLLADVQPGLIYVNGLTGLPAVHLANRRSKFPLVMHLHHLVKSPVNRAVLRRVHKRNRGGASVACSGAVAEYCGLPLGETTIIHNGVDVDRYQPGNGQELKIRESLGSAADRFLVCFVGDIGGIKPHGMVVDAALAAAQNLPQLQIVFAGRTLPEGEETVARAKAAAAQLDIPDLFLFLGWRTDLEHIYPACDLTIIGHDEGFPLSGLESAACGTMLALPSVGGGNELGGLLGISARYSPGDHQSLALLIHQSATRIPTSAISGIASIVGSRFSNACFQKHILNLVNDKAIR